MSPPQEGGVLPSRAFAGLFAEGGGSRAARIRWVLAWAVTLLYAGCLAVAMGRHEMWRDELQAWLLARDAPSWWGVLRAIRYEGHPGLWHLLLWPVARLSWNPAWMQVAHGAVASSAVWVFVRHAPFLWPARVLLPFGYVLFYEWGVISRNYAISALLMFLFCVAFARRWRSFPWAAAALAAACHTNVHSLVLVLVLTPLLMVDYAVSVAGRWRDAHRCRRRTVLAFALVLMGIASAARQLKPPDDTGFATQWHWAWSPDRAAQAMETLLRAHAPVPAVEGGRFWNTCLPLERLLGSEEGASRSQRKRDLAVRVGWSAFALAFVLLARRPWLLLHWTAGTFALGVFFYVKYMGSLRHHAFHWLLAVVVLWMALEHAPCRTGCRRFDRAWRWAEAVVLNGVLLASAVVQIWATVVAVRTDRTQVFSNAKAAAEWLRVEGLLDGRAIFAGQRGPEVSATVAYAQIPRIFYTGRNEWGSYVVWDTRFAVRLRGRRLADELRRLRDENGGELVFVSSEPLREGNLPEGMVPGAAFNVPDAEDAVWIYRWALPRAAE